MQPELYRSFTTETEVLDSYFSVLGNTGSYVLGDDAHGLQWHIYVASTTNPTVDCPPTYTLEVCMTELCPAKVRPAYCFILPARIFAGGGDNLHFHGHFYMEVQLRIDPLHNRVSQT